MDQPLGPGVMWKSPMWWRIRPVGTAQITARTPPDGKVWTTLGTVTTGPPASISIELNAGVDAGLTGGSGTFDRLVVCP